MLSMCRLGCADRLLRGELTRLLLALAGTGRRVGRGGRPDCSCLLVPAWLEASPEGAPLLAAVLVLGPAACGRPAVSTVAAPVEPLRAAGWDCGP